MPRSRSSAYDLKTRQIVSKLLARILAVSDSYERHRKLKYKPFLAIQLELVGRIIATEFDIRTYKQTQDQEMLAEARKRRRLFKILGSTIAWVLTDFDRPYIRAMSRGSDPGFISGKQGLGLRLEILALKAAFSKPACAGIMHDMTNCLRIGDLSIIHPNHFIQTVELKAVKTKGKMGGRDHRQYVRGRDIREYYDTGRSMKLTRGRLEVLHTTGRRDRHNWQQLCSVIKKANKKGFAMRIVEKCVAYFAFDENTGEADIENTTHDILTRFGKKPAVMIGLLSDAYQIPGILPLTCFDLPLRYKKQLLFGRMGLSVFVDLDRLAGILNRRGFRSKVMRNRRLGLLRIRIPGLTAPVILTGGFIQRLIYEFMSVETIVGYVRDLGMRMKNLSLEQEEL